MEVIHELRLIREELEDIKDFLAELNKYRFANQYIDMNELCHLLKISKRTAMHWRKSGYLRGAMLGRKVYYELTEIAELYKKEQNAPGRLDKYRPPKRKNRLITGENATGLEIKV